MVTTSDSGVPDVAEQEAAPSRFSRLTGSARLTGPRGRWLAVAIFAVIVIALFAAYLGQARAAVASSESAGQALQAWDMLHGNPLLRGWTLSDVSFYTTELPEYMLVELVRGLNSNTVHIAAALSYTLIIALAALLAKGRATGREGLVRALIAAGIILAPDPHDTVLLLSSPDHVGTHVPLLLIFLVLDRGQERERWWLPIVITVLLAWALIADTLVLYEGVLPLAAACATRMYRRRREPRAAQRYDLSLLAGALVSVGVARLFLDVIKAAGGFHVKTPVAEFTSTSAMSANLWPNIGRILDVFGADFFGTPVGIHAVSPLVHLIGVFLVLWALAVAVRRFYGETDLLVQVLVIGFVVVIFAYLFGTKLDPNEIVGLLPIGAVLAGRVLGGRIARSGLVPALAVVLAINAVFLTSNATQPAPRSGADVLGSWLEAHHLRYGLAGFWQAGSVTVAAGDHVQVRPARIYGRSLVTTVSESDQTWYNPRRHDASFVIASWHQNCQGTCVPHNYLRAEFGPPAHAYHVAGYVIMVWNKNLLTQVPILTWCGGWPWNNPSSFHSVYASAGYGPPGPAVPACQLPKAPA